MIQYKTGNIFNENVDAIVNTVNCVGVMGRGIALQFKKNFPENFKFYERACRCEEVSPGKMLVYATDSLSNPKFIINFPSKRHWRGASRLEDIEAGLKNLADVVKMNHITSIALPPVGCGLGGLDWNIVRPLIEKYLGANCPETNVIVFEPAEKSKLNINVANAEVPKMTAGRAALIMLFQRYLEGLLDPVVTLLEIHKLMYFLQESGELLKLKYNKAYYGPYAENLSQVLKKVEGHYLVGYGDGGDSPDKPLNLVPGAAKDAAEFLQSHPSTKMHIQRVSELVDGFETPYGLELLSTVHWVVSEMEAPYVVSDVIRNVHQWGIRKKQFTEGQITLALGVLLQKGWLR